MDVMIGVGGLGGPALIVGSHNFVRQCIRFGSQAECSDLSTYLHTFFCNLLQAEEAAEIACWKGEDFAALAVRSKLSAEGHCHD